MSALWLIVLAIIVLLAALPVFVTWWLWQDERDHDWRERDER